MELQKTKQQIWIENNREKLLEYKRNYWQANKERLNAKCKEWSENNPDKVKEIHKKYREKNKDTINEKNRQRYEESVKEDEEAMRIKKQEYYKTYKANKLAKLKSENE